MTGYNKPCNYKAEKIIISLTFHCLLYFLRMKQKGFLSMQDADEEQVRLFQELRDINRREKLIKKICLLKT